MRVPDQWSPSMEVLQMILRQDQRPARTNHVHGFMPQELLAFSLPARRTREKVWERSNGHYSFLVTAGSIRVPGNTSVTELPSGKYARAALLFLCTQAKLTNDPTVTITDTYRSFIEDLGMKWQGIERSREAVRQLMLVSAATFTIHKDGVDLATGDEGYDDKGARFSGAMNLWTTNGRARISLNNKSTITLAPMFAEMLDRAAPISLKSWRWLLTHSKSPMALDVYMWLCARLHRCESHTRVSWFQLYNQFGSSSPLPRFKQHFREALDTALLVYSEAQIREDQGITRTKGFKGFHLFPSPDPRDSRPPSEP